MWSWIKQKSDNFNVLQTTFVISNTSCKPPILTHGAWFLSSCVQSITTSLHSTVQKKEIEDNLTVKKLPKMIQARWSKFVSADNLVDGRHPQFDVMKTKLSLLFLAETQNHWENISTNQKADFHKHVKVISGRQRLKNVKCHMGYTIPVGILR